MAASGEYAKGFVEHGNFNCIEKYGKKGDVFVISIGINDGKYYKGDEYKKVVADMVKRAKAKGMDVILVKQQGRKGDSQLSPLLTGRYFTNELDQIAKEQDCQVVDLFKLWQDHCVSIGGAKADAMYIDNVHPNRSGADKLAELFASQFKNSPTGNSGTSSTTATTSATQPQVTVPTVPASDIADGQIYTFKNINSGLYLNVENGNAANGANIEQSASAGKQNQFKAVSAGDGYFYLVSQLGDGNSYALDVNGKKTADGTNIELYTFNKGENQKFRIIKNDDGTYSILTKITNGASALDVNGQSKDSGANIQQYGFNGGANQKFAVEMIGAQSAETATQTSAKSEVTLWGDANCDGIVNMSDAILIMQSMANPAKFGINGDDALHITAQGRLNADVAENGNGVTNKDALAIQKYCLQIINELPEK